MGVQGAWHYLYTIYSFTFSSMGSFIYLMRPVQPKDALYEGVIFCRVSRSHFYTSGYFWCYFRKEEKFEDTFCTKGVIKDEIQRTDNRKDKRTELQTRIYKTLQRKLKVEQHEPHIKSEVNSNDQKAVSSTRCVTLGTKPVI